MLGFSLSILASALGAIGFSPMSLFAAGAKGAWYAPWDFASMYQDDAGILPVTAVGQTVSIVLDKRFGLRRDANTCPALSTATVNGTTVTKVGEVIRFTNAAQAATADLTPTGTITNGFHEVTFTVSGHVAGAVRIQVYGTGETAQAYPATVTANGVAYKAMIDLVTGGGGINQRIRIEARGAGVNTFDVSDVTVCAVPGWHVWQTTLALKRTLAQDANGKYYLSANGTAGGFQGMEITGEAGLGYPLTIACALKADADTAGGFLSVWGGSPPYYEIQKSTTASRLVAFLRGTVNATNNETVGTNATPHVAIADFTSTTVDLEVDGTSNAAATAQANAFGTVLETRILQGGGGVANGRFYEGVIYFGTLAALVRVALRAYLTRSYT